jgi:mannose-6-phosphate isomerase
MMQQLTSLNGEVKHYDWGGISFIPNLLHIENPQQKPFAEYWMGAHPQTDCTISFVTGENILLKDFLAKNPEKKLGKKVFEKFGDLPFLLKLLDVKNMLSIQVHPSKKQAAIGFAAENKKNIPLNSFARNYKDANHKPELMVALSEFYLLHGFKPENELLTILKKNSELKIFQKIFKKSGYFGLYKTAMEMPQEKVNEILKPIINRMVPLYHQNKLMKDDENFWAAKAALHFAQPNIIDRGIFSIYFFNLLHLKIGEAIFQNAGVPHAYLEGCNVEIMANSDNVLRGGLTSKHIDTAELLKHTKCEATVPKIIHSAKNKKHIVYKTPVKDFELSSYTFVKGDEAIIETTTTEIFLLTNGEAMLSDKKNKLTLKPGNIAAIAFNGDVIKIQAKENCRLFRARTP